MRQHQGNTIDSTPLDFTGGDELVNHDLGTVGKVTKLCFPDDQGIGVIGSIAVLESENGLL
ncbi:hypothetical protein GALL_409690 [mine drainage metagenome]|uniref:Uncharacterized protein n=1 Tax=mine drainage metagenome TaxID=410659 RepID=A0A1J5Q104_9ZZZZ